MFQPQRKPNVVGHDPRRRPGRQSAANGNVVLRYYKRPPQGHGMGGKQQGLGQTQNTSRTFHVGGGGGGVCAPTTLHLPFQRRGLSRQRLRRMNTLVACIYLSNLQRGGLPHRRHSDVLDTTAMSSYVVFPAAANSTSLPPAPGQELRAMLDYFKLPQTTPTSTHTHTHTNTRTHLCIRIQYK